MPKQLDKGDIQKLKITLGYQTGVVAIEREIVDALIAAWEDTTGGEEDELRQMRTERDEAIATNEEHEDLLNTLTDRFEKLQETFEEISELLGVEVVDVH